MGSGGEDSERDVTVRPATREDVARLGAFNRAMALETEGKDLDPDRLRAGIEAVERQRGAAKLTYAALVERCFRSRR